MTLWTSYWLESANSLENFLNDKHDKLLIETDEDGNKFLEIEVPGFNKSNIKVTFKKGLVEVKGEKKTRSFFKKVYIGKNVKDIKAKIEDGILKITFVNKKDDEDVKLIPLD